MTGEGKPRARRPRPFENLEWQSLFASVGLDSNEKIDRLNCILVAHLLVDRLLTLVVAAKLGVCGEATDVEKIIVDVAPLTMPKRTELAQHLGVIEPAVAENILEVNRVRNKLVHFKPKEGTPGWDVDQVEEIATQEAFDRCVRKGIEVTQALMGALNLTVPNPKKGGEVDGSTG